MRGSVVDARGGEALSNVVVQLVGAAYRGTTDSAGHFRIAGVTAGDYVLNVSTVGYHLLKKSFHLDAGAIKDSKLSSAPRPSIRPIPWRYRPAPSNRRTRTPSALVLAGNDAKNLASVLADDPLRAVQGLPGVTSNNDFDARFAVRGAGFSQIGLYLDGVLLHQPFHMVQGQRSPERPPPSTVTWWKRWNSRGRVPRALRRPHRSRARHPYARGQPYRR